MSKKTEGSRTDCDDCIVRSLCTLDMKINHKDKRDMCKHPIVSGVVFEEATP